jgi:hypothetical protein
MAKRVLERRATRRAPLESVIKEARARLAIVSILTLYGAPKIDESLRNAWQRCLQSAPWRACREEHGGFDEYGGERGDIFIAFSGARIGEYFRKYLLPSFPGADETEKLGGILQKTPDWLVWFSHTDLSAAILGLDVPNLSRVKRFARKHTTAWCLPEGPFELKPLAPGECDQFYVRRSMTLADKLKGMTPRQQKRLLRYISEHR